jgi:hypothetical protein
MLWLYEGWAGNIYTGCHKTDKLEWRWKQCTEVGRVFQVKWYCWSECNHHTNRKLRQKKRKTAGKSLRQVEMTCKKLLYPCITFHLYFFLFTIRKYVRSLLTNLFFFSFVLAFTFPEHLNSTPVFSGVHVTRFLALCVCFVDRCLYLCTFSFGHCVVCSSPIYGFWLPLWYLQTLLQLIISNGSFVSFRGKGGG